MSHGCMSHGQDLTSLIYLIFFCFITLFIYAFIIAFHVVFGLYLNSDLYNIPPLIFYYYKLGQMNPIGRFLAEMNSIGRNLA
jgi:hypothetical protein